MRKLLLTLFLVASAVVSAEAQSKTPVQSRDSLVVRYTIYYDWNSTEAQGEQKQKLHEVGKWLKENSTTKVTLTGWADPLHNEAGSIRVAQSRAKAASQWLQVRYDISPERITLGKGGVDLSAKNNDKAHRVDIAEMIQIEITSQSEPEEEVVQLTVVEHANTESKKEETIDPSQQPMEDMTVSEKVAEIPQVVEESKTSHLSLRANLLYWAGGLMNGGVEYKAVDSRMSYLLNGGYSPFGNTSWDNNLGGWFVAPEIRYYLGETQNWFVGAQFLAGGYNYKMSETGYQGTVIGGGITGGYKITLSKTFDMDFSLGLGYGSLKYDTYYHTDTNYNVLIERGVSKGTFMPIQAGVTLIWKLW